jgi:hypothetical protein
MRARPAADMVRFLADFALLGCNDGLPGLRLVGSPVSAAFYLFQPRDLSIYMGKYLRGIH